MKKSIHKNLLVLATSLPLSQTAFAILDLAQSPANTKDPYVAPNVIISIDDSGSMGFRLDDDNTTNASSRTEPECINGICNWPNNSRRMNVLKHSLNSIFSDETLLPDKKIRLGWQAMHNNGNSIDRYSNLSYWYGGNTSNPGKNKTPGADNVGSASSKNNLKILDSSHRNNFKEFVNYLLPQGGTPSHKLFKQADEYLRKTDQNGHPVQAGPWATNPGGNDEKSREFLSCRRNYHIMMTDGRWNGDTSGGNRESANYTLPDGTSYIANSNQTKIFYDNFSNTLSDWAFYSWSRPLQPKLYSNNETGKQVPISREYRRAPLTEKIGGREINKYWNPKYNPANWPHLVTYTIGFSNDAITWPGSNIVAPSVTNPFGEDNDYIKLITGEKTWPEMKNENVRALDLWHAAINSRGKFYAIRKGEDLEKAFREIIGFINTENEPDRSTVAITGTSVERKDINSYITYYSSLDNWSGYIKSSKISRDGKSDDWNGKSTADILDTETNPINRKIFTWNDLSSSVEKPSIEFKFSNLSQNQKICLNIKEDVDTEKDSIYSTCNTSIPSISLDNLASERVDYIRGDRSKEAAKGGNVKFRDRSSSQGAIINSSVWFTGSPASNFTSHGYDKFTLANSDRPPMIYVGGNDGMLHGFSAKTGQEVMAYIPKGVFPNLTRLTWKSFNDDHRYFVDGSPLTGDAFLPPENDPDPNQPEKYWKTLLVGTLGAGGKGYFILDVTQPTGSTKESTFSEANLLVMDKTLHINEEVNCTGTGTSNNSDCLKIPDADIGHIYSTPTTEDTNPLRTTAITRLNNGRWAAILGNGYNSKNERPVLLIQYLDGKKELHRIPATAENLKPCGASTNPSIDSDCHNVTDNGLSAPRLVDIDGNGIPDVVYAGDIKGNVWKFLIGSSSQSEWGVAFNGKPLYTAYGGTLGSPGLRQIRQPISMPPSVKANDRMVTVGTGSNNKSSLVGGMMVAFGTGRDITKSDPEDTNIQTMYSVIDNTRYLIDNNGYVTIHPGDSKLNIPSPTPIGSGISQLVSRNVSYENVKRYEKNNSDLYEDDEKFYQFWKLNASTAIDWNTHNGWYLDFPETSERLLKPTRFYEGSNILLIHSQVPAKGTRELSQEENCIATTVDKERQYMTLINIMDGLIPSVPLLDVNNDGLYDQLDLNYSRVSLEKGARFVVTGESTNKNYGKPDQALPIGRLPESSLRPNWRQLQ